LARISFGKNKFWFGFKKLLSVDMGSGVINRVRVVFANETDANKDNIKKILPDSGAVAVDKGFVGAIDEIENAGLHSMVILKNNMKDKNKDLDRFIAQATLSL
jgi:hypothetical protein